MANPHHKESTPYSSNLGFPQSAQDEPDMDKSWLAPSSPNSASDTKGQSSGGSPQLVNPSSPRLQPSTSKIGPASSKEHNTEANLATPSRDQSRSHYKSPIAKGSSQVNPNNSTFSMFSRFGRQRKEEKTLQSPPSANQIENVEPAKQALRRSRSESEIAAMLAAQKFSPASDAPDTRDGNTLQGLPSPSQATTTNDNANASAFGSSHQVSRENSGPQVRSPDQQPSETIDHSKTYGKLTSLWATKKAQIAPSDGVNDGQRWAVRDEHHKSQPASRDRSTSRQRTPPRHDDAHERHRHNEIQNRERSRDVGLLNKTFRSGTSKAAEGLGKARNLFKSQKTSTPPTANMSERYIPQIVNLPLVEQTRATRITKRLELCRDKTEFWMPALPWRCIDYLNSKGSETEGIYRVPGSQREIDFYRQKFDQERDVNLFEETGLYDVNVIASLFKWWLRDLHDEIFPIAQQTYLCEKYADADKAPQELKDILSHLSPFQYYLLFAITCHLSLVHACADKNKMTYQNLQICFQASLKLHSLCFYWLVVDWRHCWQGCATEEGALSEEYEILDPATNPRTPVQQFSHSRRPSEATGFSKPVPLVSSSPKDASSHRRDLGSNGDDLNTAVAAIEEPVEPQL